MTITLYMDEQVPIGIATGLRRRGVDVLTVQEDGRSGYQDPILLDRATELGRNSIFWENPASRVRERPPLTFFIPRCRVRGGASGHDDAVDACQIFES
ncbi:MAG: DUF5615 family PIN-like protein [Hormoscilla sp. GM102CHS1]|nr:DUF5615 family PIN-like protein [Hormoscilla sp. GM102CHS1]